MAVESGWNLIQTKVPPSITAYQVEGRTMPNNNRADILLVEDNLGDVLLVAQALAETDIDLEIHHVRDGIEATRFLRREAPYQNSTRPAIIMLDLNLPGRDGRAVLKEITSDPSLALTPVIVFSGSDSPRDMSTCYALHADCHIVKPLDLFSLTGTNSCVADLWLHEVRLPPDLNGQLLGEAIR